MNQQGFKYLSGALMFIVITLAFMFRYEYEEGFSQRVNRFTGNVQLKVDCGEGQRYLNSNENCKQESEFAKSFRKRYSNY